MGKSQPGRDFQDEIKRSIPKTAGNVETWCWKPPDVPQFGLRCRKCHRGILKRACTVCKQADDFDPRFTPKHPFDLIISAPVRGAGQMRSSIRPQIIFTIELKRTEAKPAAATGELHSLLPFKAVKPHQVSGLQKAAAGGHVAGILWLAEGAEESQCHFIRIDQWLAYQETASGKSMPLAAARAHGTTVEEDVGRGSSNRYWKFAELMMHFGAEVDPTAERKTKAKAEKLPRLFDDLPPEKEKIPF